MTKGTLRYFNDAYGFGFIWADEGKDVFIHYSDIQAEGFKTLSDGDRLSFNIVDGARGPVAKNVTKLP